MTSPNQKHWSPQFSCPHSNNSVNVCYIAEKSKFCVTGSDLNYMSPCLFKPLNQKSKCNYVMAHFPRNNSMIPHLTCTIYNAYNVHIHFCAFTCITQLLKINNKKTINNNLHLIFKRRDHSMSTTITHYSNPLHSNNDNNNLLNHTVQDH